MVYAFSSWLTVCTRSDFDGVVVDQGILLGAFVLSTVLFFHSAMRRDVGQYEEAVFYIALTGLRGLVRQLHGVHFLVDDEVQLVGNLRHAAVVVLHVDVLRSSASGLDALFAEELDQRFVSWADPCGLR